MLILHQYWMCWSGDTGVRIHSHPRFITRLRLRFFLRGIVIGIVIKEMGTQPILELSDYRMNYSLNNGLYYSYCTHSHLLFGQLKSSIMGCVSIFLPFRGLKSLCNSSRLINRRCEWTIKAE